VTATPARRALVDPRVEATPSTGLGLRDLVDALFVLGLTAVALVGFRTTFTGSSYLVAGIGAALVGVGLAALVAAWRLPVLVLPVLVALAYYLFAGVLVFRDQALGGVLPNADVVRGLTSVTADGWKRLLTTLPPVAGTGQLLAVPYLIGLLSGSVGAGLALRTRVRLLPALAPALALAAVILLGTARPAAQLLQGVAFGAVVVCWAAVRRGPGSALAVRGVPGALSRLLVGAAVLAVAGAAAAVVGPHLPGHDTERTILRPYVRPPFDLAKYPSPLVGFRKYTKPANQLYDQPLFTVSGVGPDDAVRLATLDGYDGAVWGATNADTPADPGEPLDSFQRVGSRVTTEATGRTVRARITVEPGYAAARDIDAWVPAVGTLRSIDFTGPNAAAHDDGFRYNLATSTGVVADRLAAGDAYTVTGIVPPATKVPADAAPYGPPTIDASADSFVAGRANQWSARATGTMDQVAAVARYMHDNGAYSDGGPGEAEYLPGHSVNRLTIFLNAPQLVGDDEQYAAAYALICNYLGLPARVVLLAEPEAAGVVEGKDVHTAVEVHIRSGANTDWVTIPRGEFMPDRTRKPNRRPPQTIQDADAAVVPPPNPARPPSTLDQPDRPDQNVQHLPKQKPKPKPSLLSGASYVLVFYIGLPLLLVTLICLLIVGAKWRRRTRRRRRGSIPDRFDAGWREFVDGARDHGAVVAGGRTRHEQALALAERPAGHHAEPLAAAADAGVFGPGTPPQEALDQFWHGVDAARRAMARGAGTIGRVRAALNLRSLRRPTRAARG
jgi:hypothetical protein